MLLQFVATFLFFTAEFSAVRFDCLIFSSRIRFPQNCGDVLFSILNLLVGRLNKTRKIILIFK